MMAMRARLNRILKVRWTLRRFARDTTGAVAVMAALMFPVLVGGMALGAEAGYWYLSQRKLQQAADFAAHTGAVQLRSGRNNAEMVAAATKIAVGSSFVVGEDTLALRNPPTTGSRAGNPKAVEVTISRQQTRYFTLIYSTDDVDISARAVAEVRGGANACLIALDPTASGAISMSGSPQVTLAGCAVATNSNAPNAFSTSGNPKLTADCLHSVGGVSTNPSHLNLTACTAPDTESPVVRDPYANLPEPHNVGTCASRSESRINRTTTVSLAETHPNGMRMRRYCDGLNISGNGTVTFSPGLYIISGGSFSVSGSGVVQGSGVTFFLTNGATIDFTGSAKIDLSAPSSGALPGILFYGDRDDAGATHKSAGGGERIFNGAVYLPSGDLDWTGSSSVTNGCAQIITRRVKFSGNSSLKIDCSAPGTRPSLAGEIIALVE